MYWWRHFPLFHGCLYNSQCKCTATIPVLYSLKAFLPKILFLLLYSKNNSEINSVYRVQNNSGRKHYGNEHTNSWLGHFYTVRDTGLLKSWMWLFLGKCYHLESKCSKLPSLCHIVVQAVTGDQDHPLHFPSSMVPSCSNKCQCDQWHGWKLWLHQHLKLMFGESNEFLNGERKIFQERALRSYFLWFYVIQCKADSWQFWSKTLIRTLCKTITTVNLCTIIRL